jgi:sulfate permease, SulP family
LPDFSWSTVKLLVTPTLTIALLGAIESLLCARVGDQVAQAMQASAYDDATQEPAVLPHDPNQELMAQGIANMLVPFIGGMPATGTIARTVTNVRAGGRTPVAGVVHALTILAIVLLAAPLAMHVPLAVLAGVLLFVAWNMGEWREFARLKNYSNHYRLVLLGTFVLTVVLDLTVALEVGMVLACVLFVRRMGVLFSVEQVGTDTHTDTSTNTAMATTASFVLRGALFFGAVVKMDAIAQYVQHHPSVHTVQLDCSQLMALDTSGIDALQQLAQALAPRHGQLILQGLQLQPLSLVRRSGLTDRVTLQV